MKCKLIVICVYLYCVHARAHAAPVKRKHSKHEKIVESRERETHRREDERRLIETIRRKLMLDNYDYDAAEHVEHAGHAEHAEHVVRPQHVSALRSLDRYTIVRNHRSSNGSDRAPDVSDENIHVPNFYAVSNARLDKDTGSIMPRVSNARRVGEDEESVFVMTSKDGLFPQLRLSADRAQYMRSG